MDRASGIRWSILAALGLLPVACGGSATRDGAPEDNPAPGGTAATGADASGGKSGSGGASQSRPTCTSPIGDPKTGLVRCQEGYQHRVEAVACAFPAPSAQGGQGGAGGTDGVALPRADGQECERDSDCDGFYLGYCHHDLGGDQDAPRCESGCAADADCADGWICICNGSTPGGVCQQSNCTKDSDCADGFLCASFEQGCGASGFACQTPEDECNSTSDCEFGACGGNVIGSGIDGPEGRRVCDDTVCGRPFLVRAEARVAPLCTSQAWSDGQLRPRVDHLALPERQALAAHWTRMGQMEHASIAAFARFQLQLLALGAPPGLIEGCTRALGDETQHTKLCFDLASAYAGHAVGPGPLDIAGCLLPTSLVDIVDLVLAEGCFGETSAALDALEAAALASDPLLVAAYTQIARDEQRHAELAFLFLRWALQHDHHAVAPRIVHALTANAFASTAVQDVVEPCLCALLSRRNAA